MFSSIDLAPLDESITDHCLSVKHLSVDGHLFHMHAYVDVALSIPVTIAKNFQSPPKK